MSEGQQEYMEQEMNIYQRLSAARKTLHEKKLDKSGKNNFAGYEYFELSDFLKPIIDIERENGFISLVSFNEQYATLTMVNLSNPEDKIVFTSPLSKAALKGAHDVQNLGAVETYQRRYLYMMAYEIVEHDGIDSSKPVDAPKPKQTRSNVFVDLSSNSVFAKAINDSGVELETALEVAKKEFGCEKGKDIPIEKRQLYISRLHHISVNGKE